MDEAIGACFGVKILVLNEPNTDRASIGKFAGTIKLSMNGTSLQFEYASELQLAFLFCFNVW